MNLPAVTRPSADHANRDERRRAIAAAAERRRRLVLPRRRYECCFDSTGVVPEHRRHQRSRAAECVSPHQRSIAPRRRGAGGPVPRRRSTMRRRRLQPYSQDLEFLRALTDGRRGDRIRGARIDVVHDGHRCASGGCRSRRLAVRTPRVARGVGHGLADSIRKGRVSISTTPPRSPHASSRAKPTGRWASRTR